VRYMAGAGNLEGMFGFAGTKQIPEAAGEGANP